DAQAGKVSKRHVVGDLTLMVGAMRVKDCGEAESLRCLRAVQLLALDEGPTTGLPAPPERVGNGKKGHRAVGAAAQHTQYTVDQGVRRQRERGVMDQNEIRSHLAQRLKPISNRVLSCRASDYGFAPCKGHWNRVLELGDLVRADHKLNRVD